MTDVFVTPPAPVEVTVGSGPAGPPGPSAPTFDFVGPLFPALSDPWAPIETVSLASLLFALRVAGSTDTELSVLKNGAAVASVTLPAGQALVPFALPSPGLQLAGQTDVLQLRVDVAGTGAQGLGVTAR